MHYILTFPAFGTWLTGPVRGRRVGVEDESFDLPEPDRKQARYRRGSLKWRPVELDESQRRLVAEDIRRVASIRNFVVHDVVVAPDHVHVLFSCDDDADVGRLIQFIKGAPARALSVAQGDETAHSTSDAPLPHHKWWGRQYVLQELGRAEAVDHAKEILAVHC